MRKTVLPSIVILLLVIFAFPLFYSNYSQVVSTNDQKLNYELPYPGILPDNPLYLVKALRDRLQEFTIRDTIKKAEYYLLLSDKRVSAAQLLVKKGKDKQSVSTLSKAEKYFLKIPPLLAVSKKQGVKPLDELLIRLKLSNVKHLEVINSFIKQSSQDEAEPLKIILENNQKIKKELNSL